MCTIISGGAQWINLMQIRLQYSDYRLGLIISVWCEFVRVKVVFRKTVVGDWRFDYLSGSHLQSQVKSCRQMNVFMPLVLVWIGQFCIAWSVVVLLLSVVVLLLFSIQQIIDTPEFKPFTRLGLSRYVWWCYKAFPNLSGHRSQCMPASFQLASNLHFIWLPVLLLWTCTDFVWHTSWGINFFTVWPHIAT